GEPGFEPGFTVLETVLMAVRSLPRGALSLDAGGGTRTPTLSRAPGPKPGLSTQIPARPRSNATRSNRYRCHARPRKILDLTSMEVTTVRPGYELWRPNREKAEAKTT